MKRIFTLLLAAAAVLMLASCSANETADSGNSQESTANSTPTDGTTSSEDSGDAEDSEDAGDAGDAEDSESPADADSGESAYGDALAALDAAWAAYPENDKFPVMGGSTDIAAEYNGKPGPFTLTMTEEMTNNLKVPESIMPQIQAAASMINMMNANTFTSAAFEIDGDIDAFSTALVDSVNNTQWMCGFPETVITFKTDNCLIMAFGNGEIIENFKTAVTTAVDGAALVHDGPVSFGDGNGGDEAVPVL